MAVTRAFFINDLSSINMKLESSWEI